MNNATATENTVELQPEGYVLVTLVGDQNLQAIEAVTRRCRELVERLQYEQKPVWGLIDVSRQKGFDAGSNKAAMETLGQIDYDRAALCGANGVLTEVVKMLVMALGKDDRTKVFATSEEAVAWLVMRDPLAG
jgi:hypothetical protein